MADFINTVDILGDDVLTDMIINRTVSEYHDNTIKTIGYGAFYGCADLTSVKLPVVTNIGNYAFGGYCKGLTSLDFPNVTNIETNAFRGCSALTTFILRNNNVIVTLENSSAFDNTPIASGTGYIYVPSALVNTYKTKFNWQKYANQFRAIEDYTVDGTITGELDESKI